MKKLIPIFLVFSLFAIESGFAESNNPGAELMAEHFYSPQLVIKHAREISLSNKQKDKIKQSIKELEAASLDIKWELQEHAGDLIELVKQESVNEREAIATADALMNLETAMKKLQLTLLIRIKNLLTSSQKKNLERYR